MYSPPGWNHCNPTLMHTHMAAQHNWVNLYIYDSIPLMPIGYQDRTSLQRQIEPRLRLESLFGTEPTQGTRRPAAGVTQPALYRSYPASAQDELRIAIARCRQPGSLASRQTPMPVSRKPRCPDGTFGEWRRLGGSTSGATPTPPWTPRPVPCRRRCPMAPVTLCGDAEMKCRWLAASVTQPVRYPSYPARAQDELRNVIARCRRPGSPTSLVTPTPLETLAAGGDSVMETRSGGYGVGDIGWVEQLNVMESPTYTGRMQNTVRSTQGR
ncbi:hypothetical protein HOY82DRAFT_641510 [Tuber indicum]|nr:hypothetical protein HOY82DRAFT_641510 [Tuber indicum]